MDSKEIPTLLFGIAGSIAITISFNLIKTDFSSTEIIYIAIGIIVFFVAGIIWFLSSKTTEIEIKQEKQEKEQKKLLEKLKIYELLIDMKAEIKYLQKIKK